MKVKGDHRNIILQYIIAQSVFVLSQFVQMFFFISVFPNTENDQNEEERWYEMFLRTRKTRHVQNDLNHSKRFQAYNKDPVKILLTSFFTYLRQICRNL